MKRVKIISDNDGRAVVEMTDGSQIPMLENVRIHIEANEVNRAFLTIACVDARAEADATFLILFDGRTKGVKRIEFKDGTVWDAS